MTPPPSALDGLKVLDLSSNAPGPFCTMVLADLGADVTVVDRPAVASQWTERGGIPNATTDGLARPHFDAFMRNKRRIAVDMKTPEGAGLVQRLASQADVLVVEMRPGKPEKLGLGYEQLRSSNPGLIYCSITGFGHTGPLKNHPGHDLNYLGQSGALSLFARRQVPPIPPPNMISDYGATSLLATTSILAAAYARQATGRGQFIDIAMSDATTYLVSEWISTTLDPVGNPDILADYPPYDTYVCADDELITVGCVEPWFWATLCDEIGRNDLVSLAGQPDQHAHLRSQLGDEFMREPSKVWIERLSARDVPVGPVNSLAKLGEDEQVRARHMIVDLKSPHGPVQQVGIAPKLSETPGSIRRLGVARGADAHEVLAHAGYSADEITQLRASGAVLD